VIHGKLSRKDWTKVNRGEKSRAGMATRTIPCNSI
jgi:hypothetical protein